MYRHIITAYAAGSAMGTPMAQMSRTVIRKKFSGIIDHIIDPKWSAYHSGLPYAAVSDDTRLLFHLMYRYSQSGQVTIQNTADELYRQMSRPEGALLNSFAALEALDALRRGEPPEDASLHGTCCGGMLRTPAAVLYQYRESWDDLCDDIYHCLAPTHNTSTALEAAGAYGFALLSAIKGVPFKAIIRSALSGSEQLQRYAPFETCAASCKARIRFVTDMAQTKTRQEMLDTLYSLFGTGIASIDVCTAVFGIFAYARKDTWNAIRMGASIGGNTAAIAALAGALSAAHAGHSNIPDSVIQTVFHENPDLLTGM